MFRTGEGQSQACFRLGGQHARRRGLEEVTEARQVGVEREGQGSEGRPAERDRSLLGDFIRRPRALAGIRDRPLG